MRGQWMGNFEATNWRGTITFDTEVWKDSVTGRIYLYPEETGIACCAFVYEADVRESSATLLLHVNPISNGNLVWWENIPQVFPGLTFAKIAQAEVRWNDSSMTVEWHSETGTGGTASLTFNDATAPSRLNATSMSWVQFKNYVTELEHRRHVFRGQKKQWRLRSTYHRRGRCDLIKYTNEDMTLLHRHITARTRHLFNRSISDENGAMLHLAQHHGFPTPLIDWSYSPFVAAFFAFHRISKDEAKNAGEGDYVRLFKFDREGWWNDFTQLAVTAPAPRHFSLLEFLAVENERVIPQQALSGLTNIDDVETYIAEKESEMGRIYLEAIDIHVSERAVAMKELAMMGITAGSLFPGFDGSCEELTERLFPS